MERIEAVEPDSREASLLLSHYYAALDERFPSGFQVEVSGVAEDDELRAPQGCFLVALVGQVPVACGAVRRLDESTAEIKRMYVEPAARGHGLGRRMLAALEEAAAAMRCSAVRLDTSAHLPEAIALYRSAGYADIPAYNDNPYAAHWLEKQL